MAVCSTSDRPNHRQNIVELFIVVCGLWVFGQHFVRIDLGLWQEVAVFAVLSFLAQIMSTRLPQGANFSVSFSIDLVLIALYGTAPAVVTGFLVTVAAGVFSRVLGGSDRMAKILGRGCQAALVVNLAASVYGVCGHSVLAFTVASVAYFAAVTFFIAVDGVFALKQSIGGVWLSVARTLYINFFVLSSLAYLLTYIIRNSTPEWKLFSVLLFFVPVMLVSHAFRLSVNIKRSYLHTVKTMVRAIEAKDAYTKGHSEHVAELTLAMAREMGFAEKELQKLEYVALLHDAGKIGVPEYILNKTGPLTPEEFAEIKRHSALGAEIIEKIRFLRDKAEVVRHHHERFDGTGYPGHLAGESIPLEARILAVADAFNAMITERPFRSAKTRQEAVEEMALLAGKQFDPKVVEVFRTVLRKRGEIKEKI